MALVKGAHQRGEPTAPLVDDEGAPLGFSVLARPHRDGGRSMTYADLFKDLGADASSFYCLAPNCMSPGGRKIKIFGGSFGNFFKHLAVWHLGEVTAQDISAALLVKNAGKSAPEAADPAADNMSIKAAIAASMPAVAAARAAATAVAAAAKLRSL